MKSRSAFFLSSVALFLGLMLTQTGHSSDGHMIDVALWIQGEQQVVNGPIALDSGQGRLEIENSHLFEFQIDPVDDPLAPQGATWLTISMSVWNHETGQWDFITDTLLGAPLGQDQVFTVANADREVTPEASDVYLVATVYLVK